MNTKDLGAGLVAIACFVLFFITVYFITTALLSVLVPQITNQTILISSHTINETITITVTQ